MRLLYIFLALAAMVLIPFFIWGDSLTGMFSQEDAIAQLQGYGAWAWAVGIGLLIADLFLPIPGTIIMSAMGYIYGIVLGGIFASLGSFLSGLMAYSLCRWMGKKAALWLLGEKDLEKGERMFSRVGGWLVVLSRWLPVFPEVIACMAGLARMDLRVYLIALLCGAIPLGFVFAAIGSLGSENLGLATGLSAGLPVVLWVVTQYFFRKKQKE